MDWRAALVDNWPYKIAALLLAVLLWLNVSAEQGEEFPLTTGVQIEVRDTAWVAVEVNPSSVTTSFRGQRGIFQPQSPVIRHVVDSVSGPLMEIELSPSMVRGFDREMNLTPVSVRPQTVEVRLEPRTSRRLPVEPRLEMSAGPGHAVLRPVLLQPDSVTVRGPESEVTSLSGFPTEVASLEDLRRTVTRELQLEPPAGLENLVWEPATIMATVEVDSLVERSLRRPLGVRGDAADRVVVEPDSVTVRLRGPSSTVRPLDPASVTAHVQVDALPEGEATARVQLEVAQARQVTAVAQPSRATVRAREEGS